MSRDALAASVEQQLSIFNSQLSTLNSQMRQQSYLHTATSIISSYDGSVPLAVFLKKFFAGAKKYGSRDRKQIASLCYHYYRLGKAFAGVAVAERIIIASFLCEQQSNDFLAFHRSDWNEKAGLPPQEKIALLQTQFSATDIFPFKEELSGGIDQLALSISYLQQPLLFLRARPGKMPLLTEKLETAGIRFDLTGEDGISVDNATKLDAIIEINTDAVVQDLNSQKVLDHLKSPANRPSAPVSAWDCCAASGGKSILLHDILQGKEALTVSDIRESILSNLKKRFAAAGIKKFNAFIADLTQPALQTSGFQLILCDAPCSGSGTWGRTPEQLYFFEEKMIDEFAERQKKIVSSVIPQLKKGGLFFYITCSVFKKENEAIVAFIKEKFHLQLLQMELLKGYETKADTMFVAVFSN